MGCGVVVWDGRRSEESVCGFWERNGLAGREGGVEAGDAAIWDEEGFQI